MASGGLANHWLQILAGEMHEFSRVERSVWLMKIVTRAIKTALALGVECGGFGFEDGRGLSE